MNKITKSLLLLAGSILGLSSCEKHIDLNLQTSPAQVVVEAVVTNGQAPYQVTLRKSGSYFTTVSAYQTVEDAVVIMTQGDSRQDTLQHLGAGVYQTSHISGIQGQTYSLRILEGNSQYSAQTTMPFVVPIDSLGQQLEKSLMTGNGKPKEGYRVSVYFHDPAGIKNYYRLRVYYNGVYDDDNIYLYTDESNDGHALSYTFMKQSQVDDEVKVELESIDKATYDFYRTLNSVTGNSAFGVPDNPTSNISAGALGYFSAYSTVSQSIRIHK